MTLYEKLREKATAALRAGDSFQNILVKTILGELDRLPGTRPGADRPDADVRNLVKKMIANNGEIVEAIGRQTGEMTAQRISQLATAKAEVAFLFTLIPDILCYDGVLAVLTERAEEIRASKSDGAAMGLANRVLKEKTADYFGADVVKAVAAIRGGA